MKESIHYINDMITGEIVCGEKVPTLQEKPEGISINYNFRYVTCPKCISIILNNKDIISYVWGSMSVSKPQFRWGKAHCLVTYRPGGGFWKEEYCHETFCGIGNDSGNWEFATKEWFLGKDGCKNCRKIYNKLIKKIGRGNFR